VQQHPLALGTQSLHGAGGIVENELKVRVVPRPGVD
jgi:hypothetical protein